MFPTVILPTLTYFSQLPVSLINIKQAQFVKLHTKKKKEKKIRSSHSETKKRPCFFDKKTHIIYSSNHLNKPLNSPPSLPPSPNRFFPRPSP